MFAIVRSYRRPYERMHRPASLVPCPHTLLLLLSLVVCPSAPAKVVYVDSNAGGVTHNGVSWATAFLRVRDGINAATGGDEVWVAASARASAYVDLLTMKGDVALYGGFAGGETARIQRDWKKNVTVLDGGGTTSSSVVTSAVEGALLDGFTVRHAYRGVSVSSGTAAIANCAISANSNGIYAGGGRVTISKCAVSGNNYGVMADGGTANVAGSTISDNSYNGVFVQYGTVNVINCTISANSWEGIFVYLSGTANVTNCTVSSNTRGLSAISGTANVANCIVSSNGTGIYREDTSIPVTLSHNDVFGNTSANYTNIADPTGSNGNISQDPKLSNIYHHIHIQPGSPCIGAGDDSVVKAGWTDIDGQPRIQGAHVDIGSDESDGTTWTVPSRTRYVSPNGDDDNDGTSWAKAKKTVGGALTVAEGTDEVWVGKGVYQENPSLPAGVSLYGGFAGTETGRRERDWKTNVTVLDGSGNIDADVVALEFLGIVLDGFTVRSSGRYSAAAYLSSGGNATVANCTFSGNAYGVYASTYGTVTVSNCTLSGNSYGVYMDDGTVNVINCTISGNARGIYVDYGAANVTNCIVAFNSIGIYRDDTSILVMLSHNDVYRNTYSDYVNITDPHGANGNISQDPDLSSIYHDVHIQPRSPCIDAGDDSVVPMRGTDIDGQPRIQGAHVDIGSDETDGTTWTVPTRTWYVSSKGDDANDGTSWGRAKGTVKGGLAPALGTDEVWVAEGVYQESVSIPAGVSVFGGFAGSETARSQRNWTMHITVLDGNGNAYPSVVMILFPGVVLDGFTVRNAGGASSRNDGVHVTRGAATVANCTISGNSSGVGVEDGGTATVSNCSISGNSNGVDIDNGGTATISGCTISDNTTHGIYAFMEVTATITNCAITGNSNGGIDVSDGTVTVSSCSITGNGSGIYVGSGTVKVSNCTVAGNDSVGIDVSGDTATVSNCMVSANSGNGVSIYGGAAAVRNCTVTGHSYTGLTIGSADTAVVSNCIVASNGTGIYREDTSIPVTLSHNDVYENATANYTDIADPTGTNGNISLDPLFANSPDGDYHILAGSPCVDAGDDTGVTPGMTDLDGQPRIVGPHVDMGAYELVLSLFTIADAANALRISGGLSIASAADLTRLNVETGSPRVDMRDAVRISRKVAGLDANP